MLIKLSLKGDTVNPTELQRFHPFFNQIQVQSLKSILSVSKLTTLMCDTILYNQGDTLDSFYIVLSGIIILHSRDKGAVGICTFDHTCGEEAFSSPMLEFAVAQ
jgi:CRP-like cAMP-binding protein